MSRGLEQRFEQYAETLAAALSHADRTEPFRLYVKGLLLPGERKSVEPMAARLTPQRVRQTHHSLHPLVAESDWSDELVNAGRIFPRIVEVNFPSSALRGSAGLDQERSFRGRPRRRLTGGSGGALGGTRERMCSGSSWACSRSR